MTYLPATTADFVSHATTSTKESVTGAAVPCPASQVIRFKFEGIFTVAATTTGVGFGVDIPASATLVGACRVQVATAGGTDAVYEGMLTADDTFNIPADIVNVDVPSTMAAGISRGGMSAARNSACAIGARTKNATNRLTPP